MKKFQCPECNSEEVKSSEDTMRSGPPKNVPKSNRYKFMSYFKDIYKYMCQICNNIWITDKEEN